MMAKIDSVKYLVICLARVGHNIVCSVSRFAGNFIAFVANKVNTIVLAQQNGLNSIHSVSEKYVYVLHV